MTVREAPLYPWLLGPAYMRLPKLVRRMHAVAPRVEARGFGSVRLGGNPVSRMLAALLRLPAEGDDRPLAVTFEAGEAGETLSRRYSDAVLASRQSAAGEAGSGLLEESFGPLALVLRLEPSADGLAFLLQDVRCLGRSIPRALRPRVEAREFAEGGWYRFFVRVELPLLGRLIQYEGRLRRVAPSSPSASAPRPGAGPPPAGGGSAPAPRRRRARPGAG